jgi:hypothetical protein
MNEPTTGPSSVSSADARSFDVKSFDAKSCLVQFAPPDITRRRAAAWNGIRADIVDVTRREAFDYRIRAHDHVLIMCERAEREDGETRIEGLPRSTLRKFNRKLSLVPAGHEFHCWQKPRVLTRVTYFYIDPRTSLADPDLHFAEQQLRPRLFFFDSDLWETAAKLKAQAENAESGRQGYAQALGLVLIHEMLRLNGEVPPQSPVARGGLAGWQKNKERIYRRAPCRRHFSDDAGRARALEHVSLRPRVQAVLRVAAASLSDFAPRRARQGSVGVAAAVRNRSQHENRLQRHQLVQHRIPQTYRRDADRLSAQPRMTARACGKLPMRLAAHCCGAPMIAGKAPGVRPIALGAIFVP